MKKLVWFGLMEFDTLKEINCENVIIHKILKKCFVDENNDENEIDRLAGPLDWIIPSEYDGKIIFSQIKGIKP